jgi:hypothetical protein
VRLSSKQAQKLKLRKGTRISPVREKCCLILISNESLAHAQQDIEVLTGIKVPHSSQHRFGLNHQMKLKPIDSVVEELSVDGGSVRIRTPSGHKSEWRQDKAIKIHELGAGALFKEDDLLTNWVNQQPLGEKVTCLGDGHDGVWNVVAGIGTLSQRREILDWYHLMENVYKVGLKKEKLKKVKNYLWKGLWSEARAELCLENSTEADKLINYLEKHQSRIPNYKLCQQQGISIGSGQVESLIKQIATRIKIIGSQWEPSHVSQMLKLRCGYLNGDFSLSISA